MALTLGSVGPIVPFSEVGGRTSIRSIQLPVAASQAALKVGDLVTITSGKAVLITANPTTASLFGVVINPRPLTGSTVTESDVVSVVPIRASQVFIGTLVGATVTTDLVGVRGTHAIPTNYDIGIDTVTGNTIAIVATVNATVKILAMALEQQRGARYVDSTTVNPRVYFKFLAAKTMMGA